MNNLQLLSRQQPGQISIDNFQELRNALEATLKRYQNLVYTKETLSDAKADKRELSRLRREIDERRKEIKRAYLAPYNEFETQVKELLALVDTPLEEVKAFISSIEEDEKKAKRSEIEAYFYQNSGALDTMAQMVWESAAFFDNKWLNKTTPAKTWQEAVRNKIANAARDIQSIQMSAGKYASALTSRYLETFSIEGLSDYRDKLSAASNVETTQIKTNAQDRRVGSKVLKISGNLETLLQALELLKFLGLDCEILEDDTPHPMSELTEPDFDSFVAFDLETSGTYGAANGDAPAEITEIGAVRVINGEITEHFSMLVNPGRDILPQITRITGITNAMVSDQPDVLTAIRCFADFVGNAVLVGHNIKGSDLHYIDRAAQRAGIRLENSFFDTYCYARRFQKDFSWEKITLGYLAEKFEIEQSDAHRAWCDAETNVKVFWCLRSLSKQG